MKEINFVVVLNFFSILLIFFAILISIQRIEKLELQIKKDEIFLKETRKDFFEHTHDVDGKVYFSGNKLKCL